MDRFENVFFVAGTHGSTKRFTARAPKTTVDAVVGGAHGCHVPWDVLFTLAVLLQREGKLVSCARDSVTAIGTSAC